MEFRCDVAVVGGGASGALVAAGLLRRADGPWTIALVDGEGAFARGAAYSTIDEGHLLNVPAEKMGADPEDPADFLKWAKKRGVAAKSGDFLPRKLFGEYLEQVLRRAEEQSPARVLRVHSRAQRAVRSAEGGWILQTELGALRCRVIVLATGNLSPANPPVPDGGVYSSNRYIASAWKPDALREVAPDEEVFFIGTGLTTVDALVTLAARGHRGKLVALSPHGLYPRVHRMTPPRDPLAPPKPDLRALLRHLRSAGNDWRAAIDGLRPHTIRLWQAMEPAQKQRFMRHLRHFWEVHRHRMAPQVASTIEALRARGQLRTLVGRLESFQLDGGEGVFVGYRARGAREISTVHVSRVVNCTGPRSPFVSTETFFASLLADGLVRPDGLRLGFETSGGALVDAQGFASTDFYAVGPLRRGELWETTAIPEIRTQARDIAALVAGRIAFTEPVRA